MQTRTQTSVYIGDVYADGHASHRSREFHVRGECQCRDFHSNRIFSCTLPTTCTMISRPLIQMRGRSHADVKCLRSHISGRLEGWKADRQPPGSGVTTH